VPGPVVKGNLKNRRWAGKANTLEQKSTMKMIKPGGKQAFTGTFLVFSGKPQFLPPL